jgi:hypothetical protein
MSVDEFKEIPATAAESLKARSASLRTLSLELNENDLSGQTVDLSGQELDTSDEELEDSDVEVEGEPIKENEDDVFSYFAKGALFGAVFIGGLWAYLSINHMSIEHPHNQRDYF